LGRFVFDEAECLGAYVVLKKRPICSVGDLMSLGVEGAVKKLKFFGDMPFYVITIYGLTAL